MNDIIMDIGYVLYVLAFDIIVFGSIGYGVWHLLKKLFPDFFNKKDDGDIVYTDCTGVKRLKENHHPVTFGITRYPDGYAVQYWTDNKTGRIIIDQKRMEEDEQKKKERDKVEIAKAQKYGFKVYYGDVGYELNHFYPDIFTKPVVEIETGRWCSAATDGNGKLYVQYYKEPKIKKGYDWKFEKAERVEVTPEEFCKYNVAGDDIIAPYTDFKIFRFFEKDGGNYNYEKWRYDRNRNIKKLNEMLKKITKEQALLAVDINNIDPNTRKELYFYHGDAWHYMCEIHDYAKFLKIDLPSYIEENHIYDDEKGEN